MFQSWAPKACSEVGMQAAREFSQSIVSPCNFAILCEKLCPCRLGSIFICGLDEAGWDDQYWCMLFIPEDRNCFIFSCTKAACRERTVILCCAFIASDLQDPGP